MNKGRLIVYSGPSGVGKGTVLKRAMERDSSLMLSVSATTRAPREGEIDKINYFFVSKEEFQRKIDNCEMLEYAQYNGNFYGTPKDFVEENLNNGKNVVLEIEVQGALKIREIMPDAVLIFLMPPTFEELKNRLEGRKSETPEQIKGRLNAAAYEVSRAEKYDYIIVNNTVEKASEDLISCIYSSQFLTRLNKKFLNEEQLSVNNYFK